MSITGCCFHFGSISSFFLELFLHSSPVAYWHLPTWGVHFSMLYLFAFSYYSWDSQGKNTDVVCHSLLQWTTFCQNSPPWPVRLGWPYRAWLIVSLSYRRLWFMWSVWLIFCDCGFHSVCPLMDKDKRFMEGSWWERLTEEETWSSLVQGIFPTQGLNPVLSHIAGRFFTSWVTREAPSFILLSLFLLFRSSIDWIKSTHISDVSYLLRCKLKTGEVLGMAIGISIGNIGNN